MVTYHGEKRIIQRVGGNKKSADKIAQKALEMGLSHSDTHGNLYKYLTKVSLHNGNRNHVKVYNEKIYIFNKELLITVLNLPFDLCRTARQLQKNKLL